MKPDDRVLKNYVKDVCSNINKGIFEYDYGYAILKEKGIELLTLTENDSLPVSVDFHVYSLSNVVTVFPFSLT